MSSELEINCPSYAWETGNICFNMQIFIIEFGHSLRFEVLTEMIIKSSVFCDITTCSPLKINWRFGGTRKQVASRTTCTRADFLLGLFFDRENWGDIFFWKLLTSKNCMALYPRKQNSIGNSVRNAHICWTCYWPPFFLANTVGL
jgi:hypothetical protein